MRVYSYLCYSESLHSYGPSLSPASSPAEWGEQISHLGPWKGLDAVSPSSFFSCSLVPCGVSGRLPHLGLSVSSRSCRVLGWQVLVGAAPASAAGPSPVSSPRSTPQVIQLLTCDLLLSLRTALWQKQAGASQALGETYHASGAELAGFQRDLGSLRRLAHSFRPAYRKVRPSYLVGEGRLGAPGPSTTAAWGRGVVL